MSLRVAAAIIKSCVLLIICHGHVSEMEFRRTADLESKCRNGEFYNNIKKCMAKHCNANEKKRKIFNIWESSRYSGTRHMRVTACWSQVKCCHPCTYPSFLSLRRGALKTNMLFPLSYVDEFFREGISERPRYHQETPTSEHRVGAWFDEAPH